MVACRPNEPGPSFGLGTQINGNSVDPGGYPDTVMIEIFDRICTGVNLGEFILTAAHCVIGGDGSQVRPDERVDEIKVLALGRSNPLPVARVVIAPSYTDPNKGQMLDLAKVFLKPSEHAWLPSRSLGPTPSTGSFVVLVGYGRTNAEFDDPAANDIGSFRKGTNFVAAVDEYITVRGPNRRFAKEGEAVSYSGDSGGPLLDRDGRVVGILKGGLLSSDLVSNESRYTNLNMPAAREFLRVK